jgi:hypothetical protein
MGCYTAIIWFMFRFSTISAMSLAYSAVRRMLSIISNPVLCSVVSCRLMLDRLN